MHLSCPTDSRRRIEVKYPKRGEAADESVVASRVEEARTQLRGYLADPGLRGGQPAVRHVGLAVVFHGWELAACEAVGDERTGDQASAP